MDAKFIYRDDSLAHRPKIDAKRRLDLQRQRERLKEPAKANAKPALHDAADAWEVSEQTLDQVNARIHDGATDLRLGAGARATSCMSGRIPPRRPLNFARWRTSRKQTREPGANQVGGKRAEVTAWTSGIGEVFVRAQSKAASAGLCCTHNLAAKSRLTSACLVHDKSCLSEGRA
jgi:hypothetical protein